MKQERRRIPLQTVRLHTCLKALSAH